MGDLDPSTEKLRRDSEAFTESVLRARTSEGRREPWFLTLPLRPLLHQILKGASNSAQLEPFQLLALGNLLLPLMQGLMEKADREYLLYLQILEKVFDRLSQSLEKADDVNGPGVKEFLDRVWRMHNEGLLDLSKSSIPATIVSANPQKLEKVLEECTTILQSGSGGYVMTSNVINLVPFCDGRPENFLKVLEYLERLTDSGKEVRRTLRFAVEFQLKVQSMLGKLKGPAAYPAEFQPLVHFLREIHELSPSLYPTDKNVFEDEVILGEVLRNLDRIVKYSVLELQLIGFMVLTMPHVPVKEVFLRKSFSSCLWWRKAAKSMSREWIEFLIAETNS